MSYEDPDRMALLQAGYKFNAWIQKMYNLIDYKTEGKRDVRLYGSRAKFLPPQTLINSRSYFYMISELTQSSKLKRVSDITRMELHQHADLYGRWPLPYEDLADVFEPPTATEMETGLKVSSIRAKPEEEEEEDSEKKVSSEAS